MSYDISAGEQAFLDSVRRSYQKPLTPTKTEELEVPDTSNNTRSVEQAVFGEDGFSFDDILDTINPLHHIPVVNTFYRELTGDEISGAARLTGGGLYGGIFGLIGSALNWIIEETTGDDVGGHVMTALGLDQEEETPQNITDETFATTQVASATPVPETEITPQAPKISAQPVTEHEYSDEKLSLAPHTLEHNTFQNDPVAFVLGPQIQPKEQTSPVLHAATAQGGIQGSNAGRIGIWDHDPFELPPVLTAMYAPEKAKPKTQSAHNHLTGEQIAALRAYKTDVAQLQLLLKDKK